MPKWVKIITPAIGANAMEKRLANTHMAQKFSPRSFRRGYIGDQRGGSGGEKSDADTVKKTHA